MIMCASVCPRTVPAERPQREDTAGRTRNMPLAVPMLYNRKKSSRFSFDGAEERMLENESNSFFNSNACEKRIDVNRRSVVAASNKISLVCSTHGPNMHRRANGSRYTVRQVPSARDFRRCALAAFRPIDKRDVRTLCRARQRLDSPPTRPVQLPLCFMASSLADCCRSPTASCVHFGGLTISSGPRCASIN